MSTAGLDRERTLVDKIWDQHVVAELGDGLDVLHVDRHLVHDVTSPQAFTYAGRAFGGGPLTRADLRLAGPQRHHPFGSHRGQQ